MTELHIEPQQQNLAKGEESAAHETRAFDCWDSLKHTTKQEHLRDKHTLTHQNMRARGAYPEGCESHRYHRSPPVALEAGMACHLELGGGFVRGVLKPSGTCFDRVAGHLAWRTVYQ